MSQLGETSSGCVNDNCNNYYNPTDPQVPRWKLNIPKLITAGAGFLLVVIILLIIGRQLSKPNDEQPPANKASYGQVEFPEVESKIGKIVSENVHSHTTENGKGPKKGNALSVSQWDVCKKRPRITYSPKDSDKEYFTYFGNSDKLLVVSSEDSQILKRIHYQRKIDVTLKNSQPKKILILSPLGNNKEDIRKCSKRTSKNEQMYCSFTTDKNQIESADAVVFREQDLVNLPQRNNSKQIWIYNTISPDHKNKSITVPKGMFNLTGTYDFSSHIPMLPMSWYEETKTVSEKSNKRAFPSKDFTDDTVRLVVYNNDCEEEKRFYDKYKDVIKALEEDNEVIVEWYNFYNCTQHILNFKRQSVCHNQSSAECFKKIGSQKKFALAFEVANNDYISERFFDPMINLIVPIVIGSRETKYKAVSPKNSFVYFCGYGEISELRKELKHLNSHQEDFKKYFNWWINKEGEFQPLYRWYCQLCFMLLRATSNHSMIIDDIDPWRGMN